MAWSRLKLLVLNGYGSVEGDVSTMLMALQGLDRSRFDLFVASKPRGEVYERLKQIPDLKLFPMELGGTEAPAPGRTKKRQRLADSLSAIRK
ncbi:MAG: hypothetical protein H7308_14585, partial [Chthonomonadaceae bacterium]|nr:hypothetical protein [Chthonomonadaceae bacterium]